MQLVSLMRKGVIAIARSRQANPIVQVIYNIARPTSATAPTTHEAAFACAAPLWLLAVGEAAPLPLALPLVVLVPLVPLGLPEMFIWVTWTPVLFWQFEL